MDTTLSIGLLGVSTQRIRVASVIAARTPDSSDRSTHEMLSPQSEKVRVISR